MNLKIIGIKENGSDNERVLLKAIGNCNLNNYILYDETFDEKGNPSNKVPHMYRFSKLLVKKGEYVSLWTKGQKGYLESTMKNPAGAPLHIIKRGLDITIFNQNGDTVHLVKISTEDSKKLTIEKK